MPQEHTKKQDQLYLNSQASPIELKLFLQIILTSWFPNPLFNDSNLFIFNDRNFQFTREKVKSDVHNQFARIFGSSEDLATFVEIVVLSVSTVGFKVERAPSAKHYGISPSKKSQTLSWQCRFSVEIFLVRYFYSNEMKMLFNQ